MDEGGSGELICAQGDKGITLSSAVLDSRRHLDLGNRLEPIGQVIFEEAGEPSRNALMPWMRTRRHDECPLTEFPPSRPVEFKRIPLL